MHKLLSLALVSVISLASISPLVYADTDHRMERSSHTSVALTGSELTCIRSAVSTREVSVRSAYVTLTSTLLTAMDVRAKALDAAWSLTDSAARKSARESAWSTWNTTAKLARQAFRSSSKTNWEAFRISTKSCKVPSNEIESKKAQASDVE